MEKISRKMNKRARNYFLSKNREVYKVGHRKTKDNERKILDTNRKRGQFYYEGFKKASCFDDGIVYAMWHDSDGAGSIAD